MRVSETYFSILAAGDNVEFTYAERNAIARQLEEAQKRFEVGLIAITDVYEAQASFDNAEAAVILAENILENSFQALIVLTADTSIRELAPLGEDLKPIGPDIIINRTGDADRGRPAGGLGRGAREWRRRRGLLLFQLQRTRRNFGHG